MNSYHGRLLYISTAAKRATFTPPRAGVWYWETDNLQMYFYNGVAWTGIHTNLPYGSFSSSATQTCVATNLAYAITYSDTEASNQITLSNNSRINLAVAGEYLITFSAVGKSNAPNATLDIWMAVGGVNVARSNTLSRFVGAANERVITVTYIYPFTAGQYFELYMHSNTAGTVIQATGAAAGPPAVPASPSIITTVNMISR